MSAPTVRRPRLLVIDDEPSICELIGDVATVVGFDVDLASTPGEIDSRLGKGHDLVVLDLQLGGEDGISAMRTLALRSPGARVVLVSGASERIIASADRVASQYGLEVLGTCHKPFALSAIRGLLEDCRVSVCAPALTPGTQPETSELLRELDIHDLTMAYQPLVQLSDGSISAAEALVRWTHPEFGAVPPNLFVPFLEASGRSGELLAHVATVVARERVEIPAIAALESISINVSGQDLDDQDTPDRLRDLLGVAAPADKWTLELTETIAYGAAVSALDVMTRFSLMGFKLAIDDFGTGSSTLERLRSYPFDVLKIDRSFISGNSIQAPDDWIIVESAVSMGHRLGLQITAEGVEDRAVYERLRSLGCDRAQGYHMSRPVAAVDFQAASAAWAAGLKVAAQSF